MPCGTNGGGSIRSPVAEIVTKVFAFMVGFATAVAVTTTTADSAPN